MFHAQIVCDFHKKDMLRHFLLVRTSEEEKEVLNSIKMSITNIFSTSIEPELDLSTKIKQPSLTSHPECDKSTVDCLHLLIYFFFAPCSPDIRFMLEMVT